MVRTLSRTCGLRRNIVGRVSAVTVSGAAPDRAARRLSEGWSRPIRYWADQTIGRHEARRRCAHQGDNPLATTTLTRSLTRTSISYAAIFRNVMPGPLSPCHRSQTQMRRQFERNGQSVGVTWGSCLRHFRLVPNPVVDIPQMAGEHLTSRGAVSSFTRLRSSPSLCNHALAPVVQSLRSLRESII